MCSTAVMRGKASSIWLSRIFLNLRDARHLGYIEVTLGLYWGYIGIMEKKMETTIWGLGFT